MKGVNVTCKNTGNLAVSDTNIPRCSLLREDAKIEEAQKLNYRGRLLTECVKYTKIRKRIIIAKDAFQKIRQVLRNSEKTH